MTAQSRFAEEAWEAVRQFLADHPTAAVVLAPLLLAALWLLTLLVGRRMLLAAARRLVARTATQWDDMVLESGFLRRLSHIVPLLVVMATVGALPGLGDAAAQWITRAAQGGIVVVLAASAFAVLDGLQLVYDRKKGSSRRPIKGYVQLVKLLFGIGAGAVALATLVGSDVGTLVTGIGVSSAVVLLVFKDTILSLLASIHLTSFDMVRIGDWIEMPKHGADGDVVDIALHTVKVQNFDKTITTIPTFELYASSFKNWRGMQESGGRRIKRSIFVDVASARFLADDDVERLGSLRLLKAYFAQKRQEVDAANAALGAVQAADKRRLTNIGTYRAYCYEYLKAHPDVHPSMTLIVRQLQPTERGLPIELYAFTRTTAWAEYERIQSDVFDHLLAIAPEFGVRVFQLPSGADVGRLAGAAKGA
jgi:miniconductance mechanosensitive channel